MQATVNRTDQQEPQGVCFVPSCIQLITLDIITPTLLAHLRNIGLEAFSSKKEELKMCLNTLQPKQMEHLFYQVIFHNQEEYLYLYIYMLALWPTSTGSISTVVMSTSHPPAATIMTGKAATPAETCQVIRHHVNWYLNISAA